MTILDHDAPVRGVFVLLDGVRNEYSRANVWGFQGERLIIWRRLSTHAYEKIAEFGRFDQVGYMGGQA